MRQMLLALMVAGIVAVSTGAIGPASSTPPASSLEIEPQPNPRLAVPLQRKPTQQDLDRLKSVVGKRKADVLRKLGHPSAFDKSKRGEPEYERIDGLRYTEVWRYRWGDETYCVWFRGAIVIETGEMPIQLLRSLSFGDPLLEAHSLSP